MPPKPEAGKLNILEQLGLQHLLPGFLERRNEELTQLRSLLTVAEFDTIRRLGHSLKGAGTNYGFSNLSALGAEIEIAGKAADLTACTRLVETYADLLASIQKEHAK